MRAWKTLVSICRLRGRFQPLVMASSLPPSRHVCPCTGAGTRYFPRHRPARARSGVPARSYSIESLLNRFNCMYRRDNGCRTGTLLGWARAHAYAASFRNPGLPGGLSTFVRALVRHDRKLIRRYMAIFYFACLFVYLLLFERETGDTDFPFYRRSS